MLPLEVAGAALLGGPLVLLAWAVLWRRQRPVFWFAMALILVGLGYLMASGATEDIARRVTPVMVAAAVAVK